ncbi:hypothetical protein CEXT_513361 [Caerostris extrusa]|uniref:Uncharacterized protein n=1 Tax=Caerostris extrusa TaxID=172846 RepID=A0AAV4N655_CAEEX|nr:hypothetical protein CEXT_513361 [Caerostris extrusa]
MSRLWKKGEDSPKFGAPIPYKSRPSSSCVDDAGFQLPRGILAQFMTTPPTKDLLTNLDMVPKTIFQAETDVRSFGWKINRKKQNYYMQRAWCVYVYCVA